MSLGVQINVTKKYLRMLKELQEELNNTNITSLTYHIRSKNVSLKWSTFLIKNKICYRDESNFYRWNNKIPTSIKIVNKFRSFQKDCKAIDRQSEIIFDEKEIKKAVDKFSPIKKEQKVGVIRNFFRWLW
jgi:hypothetical protein